MKSTWEIIEELKRMECVNYAHYSAPKLCTKDARDRLEELQKDLNREKSRSQAHFENYLEMLKRAGQHAAALMRIRDCDFVITLPDRMDAVRAIAREALE